MFILTTTCVRHLSASPTEPAVILLTISFHAPVENCLMLIHGLSHHDAVAASRIEVEHLVRHGFWNWLQLL